MYKEVKTRAGVKRARVLAPLVVIMEAVDACAVLLSHVYRAKVNVLIYIEPYSQVMTVLGTIFLKPLVLVHAKF